jgi:excisionase family DNA binding protein
MTSPNASGVSRPPGAPWSIAEAAVFLRVSQRHLHRLLCANKLKSLRIGRRRLIPASEIDRLAQKGC